MKQTIKVMIVVGLITVGYLLIKSGTDDIAYTSEVTTFASEEQEFTVQYDPTGEFAQVSVDGTSYGLIRAEAASGAKYVSEDGTVVFWEHDSEALVEIDGEAVVTDAAKVAVENGTPETEEVTEETTEAGPAAITPEAQVPPSVEAATAVDAGASSAVAFLAGSAWQWQETKYTDGTSVEPVEPASFVLTFMDDDTFSATTDCNNVSGTYVPAASVLTFEHIASTKMACGEASQEAAFVKMLSMVQRYEITAEGNLQLSLMLGMGEVELTPVTE